MKHSQARTRLRCPVARVQGARLFLAPDLRNEIVGDLAREAAAAARSVAGAGALFGEAADRRAFAASVAYERLGELYLCLGARLEAFRAFRTAALVAPDGEEDDHGVGSLPARLLRIRFYRLLDRISACCAADARLRALADDPTLSATARRLGGRFL